VERRGRPRPEEGRESGRRAGHRAGQSLVSVRWGFWGDFPDEPEPTMKAVVFAAAMLVFCVTLVHWLLVCFFTQISLFFKEILLLYIVLFPSEIN
jgi:hypothetical protein